MTTKQKPLRLASRECNVDGCDNQTSTYKRKDGSVVVSARCTICNNNICKYGITTPQRQELLDSQGGLCLCCGVIITFSGQQHKSACSSNAVVDHCHTSGKVRGILCGNCNIVIGRLNDSVTHASLIVDYMEKYV